MPPNDPEDLTSGTLAGLIMFLTLAEQRGDLPKSVTNNLRGAVRKVFEVVHLDDDQDLRTVDQDEVFGRFHTLAKVSLRDDTRQTYEKRTRDALDRYRKFLADDSSWKATTTPKKPKSSTTPKRTGPTAVPDAEPGMATVTPMPGSNNMLTIPVPLRRGVVAHLSLPADLTDREAKRIAKIVEAFGGGEQLQLPAGTGTDD